MGDIKKGDTVVLKSGGPIMTVQDIGNYMWEGIENGAKCVWFDGNEPKVQVFDLEMLKKHQK
jgi:uncharacterized protein YodC (DUF2158 family)